MHPALDPLQADNATVTSTSQTPSSSPHPSPSHTSTSPSPSKTTLAMEENSHPDLPIMNTPPTKTLSLPQPEQAIAETGNENEFLFYMDNSPTPSTGVNKKNSELAGDDSEDDNDNNDDSEVGEDKNISSGQRPIGSILNDDRNSSSLATAAESVVVKLVGLAMSVPDALISGDCQDDISQLDGQFQESEVYLDTDSNTDTNIDTDNRNNNNNNSSDNHNDNSKMKNVDDKEKGKDPDSGLVLQPAKDSEAAQVGNAIVDITNNTTNNNIESICPPSPTTSPLSSSEPIPASLAATEETEATSITTAAATTTTAAAATTTAAAATTTPSSTESTRNCDIDASKDILTEGQAFAYVGLCLVTANSLFQALEGKESAHAKESLESFVSKLINRLYRHLEIDTDTQRTIAQLPQMMIQPQDLLETFVADGTQRVVSAQQVDQAGLSISSTSTSSLPSSPTISSHRRHLSNASLSSLSQAHLPPPQSQSQHPMAVASSQSSAGSSSDSSSASVASLPRESVSSKRSEDSFANVPLDNIAAEMEQESERVREPAPSTMPSSSSSSSTLSSSTLSFSQSTATLVDPGSGVASMGMEHSLTNASPSVSPIAASASATPVSARPSRSPSPLYHSRMSTSSQRTVSSLSNKAITVDLRWTLIADLFLISISDSVYDSRARVLLKMVGLHLGLEWDEIVQFERTVIKQLQQQSAVTSDGLLKPDTKSRNDESRKRRMIMMGLATVGGGLVLGLSAGLLAPVIGAGIGTVLAGAHITGATATAASAFLAGSGGIAVITSGAAVTGSGLAMKKMARRTAGIDTFEFLPIHDNKRANVILTIAGWLDIGEEDASLPFSTLDQSNGDHYALLWEPEMLMALGNALGLLATEVITLTAQEILKHTLLSALLSALAWPMALTRLGYLIDNPWSIALDRAKLAGLVLADSLLMRSYLGFRPVTLVGYSLGARVIFYCLMELGRLDAFGIVENAYLFGAPVTASEAQWRQAGTAVAGEFVNGYLRNDWVLGFLFRATTGGLGTVAGLRPIKNVPGLLNVDLTEHVEGHLDYRLKAPLLMKLMGLKITSESFLEKEEAILHQRSLKINPNEQLRAPKPLMPSKQELAKSGSLSETEKQQLEVAFRRPAPKAKIPDLDTIKGLTDSEREALREALEAAAAANTASPYSPSEYSRRR
ncbi:hypothetical protein BGZ94_002289 [Podila epigama]|nr:hypothetical protein BGZ94_002289 [Podila epigama]